MAGITGISIMTGLIADMAMIPYAASSDFADSWVARSGHHFCQSSGRISILVSGSDVFFNLFSSNAQYSDGI